MPFNPKAVAAMKLKEAQKNGQIPTNMTNPQNIALQIPKLAPAISSSYKPKIQMSEIKPPAPVRKFNTLRKKLSGI